MPRQITAAHHSHIGPRERNEDCAGIATPDEQQVIARGVIAAIADGVSGHEGGREAAEYCVHSLLADYYTLAANAPTSAISNSLSNASVSTAARASVTDRLDQAIRQIHRGLLQQAAPESTHSSMACTLTVLVLHEHTYYFSHIGDSRLYLLRQGKLRCLTTDHVSDLPGMRHVLTRAMGLDADLLIDHGKGELEADDIFLLATDGLWGALAEEDIQWHLSTLADQPSNAAYTAKLLVDAALAADTTDNATALVVRAGEPSKPRRHDPLRFWKLLGAAAVLLNLLLLYWLTRE